MTNNLDTKEKKNILDFIVDFKDKVGEGEWISHYDKDSDSLVMREQKLDLNTRKRYVNDEFAFYLDDKKNVRGIFIEYVTTNLISHHKKDLIGLRKTISEGNKKSTNSLVEMKKTETKKMASSLESTILDSMIGGIPC